MALMNPLSSLLNPKPTAAWTLKHQFLQLSRRAGQLIKFYFQLQFWPATIMKTRQPS